MDIRKFKPMPTRPCKYCVALQDDSVFADFEINDTGCLYLVRISFDGFGCCEPEATIGKIDEKSSKYLVAATESNNLRVPEAREILSNYFRANKDSLWKDALLEHKLI
ncbi:hypothetical protein [Neptunomonas phycophila]|uniref:hypothetical protein n=1 Tax=Neptunomonas phycophila TaxID=1572645 RepID=UPI0037361CB6